MKRAPSSFVLFALIAAGWAGPATALERPEWLYSVSIPVENQSAQAREQAASEGLIKVLSRVTGLSSVPRNDVVRAALDEPSRFYNEYLFVRGDAGPELTVTFGERAVLDLVRAARLPIWWTRRPTIVAWVALDDGRERRLLGAESEHALATGLVEAARDLGLNVMLPALDEIDLENVDAADAWGGVTPLLERASERYDADMVMTGRFSERAGSYSGDWRYTFEGQPVTRRYRGGDEVEAGRRATAALAAALAERYSVHARGDFAWDLTVTGIDGVQDYAALMGYLETLDFVDGVRVRSASGPRLNLSVSTRAEADQLLTLLTYEARLVEEDIGMGIGGSLRLKWQGS